MAERRTLLFDATLMRPGCVLLQAVGDGDRDLLMALFPSETWLVAPTDGMKRYSATLDQWKMLAARSTPAETNDG